MVLLTPALGGGGLATGRGTAGTARLPGLPAMLARWALSPFLVFYRPGKRWRYGERGQVVAILEPGASSMSSTIGWCFDRWAW